jgi:hypothetical protein
MNTMTDIEHAAWHDGYRAAERGQSEADNPYDSWVANEARRWEAWLDGYEAASMELQERAA